MIQSCNEDSNKCLVRGAAGGNRHTLEDLPRSVIHSEADTALVHQFSHAYASLRMNSHRTSHACAPCQPIGIPGVWDGRLG